MDVGGERVVSLFVTLGLLPILLTGLKISDSGEVEYISTKIQSRMGQLVTLECGKSLPYIYIWGYTRSGTEDNRAIVYDYGQGPKIQQVAEELGQLSIVPNSSSLLIDNVSAKAGGLYTCQALYHTYQGAKATFYYVQLDVL